MILVLLGGGAAGWLAHRIRTQRRAIAAVRAAGGQVSYDWQAVAVGTANGRKVRQTEPAAPAWLRRWLGDEPFQQVTSVRCEAPIPRGALPDFLAAVGRFEGLQSLTLGPLDGEGEGFAHLRGLGRLERVWLGGPGIDDAALGHLAAIRSLRDVGIGRRLSPRDRTPTTGANSPTNAGFARLAAATKLQSLAIDDCPNLTDATLARLVAAMPALRAFGLTGGPPTVAATLAALGKHPDLESLGLDRTGVADADLAAVAGLTRLHGVSLQGTGIGDAGIAHLRGLQGVRELLVNGTLVGDSGLEVVGGLMSLEGFYASKTRITDAGIPHLARLAKLRELAIGLNDLTDAAMPPLAGLAGLERLDLTRTPALTDAGLAPLRALTKLKRLAITRSRVTPEGIAALQQAVPSLTRVTTQEPAARPAPAAPPAR